MDWQEACSRPELQHLPYKIELDERGRIVMSPTKVYHSVLQARIAARLDIHGQGGVALTECAIRTRKGTKVADVAWASSRTYQQIKDETECSVAPEICVEIMSASNTDKEIEERRELFFEHGAQEFWLCDQDGHITYSSRDGPIPRSACCPVFADTDLRNA